MSVNISIKFNNNDSKKHIEEFVYKYGNRTINIKMYDESFLVSFCVVKSLCFKSVKDLFVDIIKKIYLIYAIYNNKLFNNDSISFYINDKLIYSIREKVLFSLFDTLNDNKITSSLRDKRIIEKIISYPKSNYDYKIASLFAYICAKSKIYECERLQYYWMAFNGYYNKYKGGNKVTQQKLINILLKDHRLISENQEFTSEEMNKSVLKIVPIIREIGKDSYFTNRKTTQQDIQKISISIKEKLNEIGINKNIDPYGYVLTQIPYYYRCNMIHGSEPIKLFLTICENDILIFKFINDILEEFLDLHIAELFQ